MEERRSNHTLILSAHIIQQRKIVKLTDADSEQLETQHWLEVSEESNYMSSDKTNDLLHKCESIGKMIHSMIGKSSIFCSNQ